MIAHAIAKYLAANVPGLTYGTGPNVNVFVDWMPNTPHKAVAVMSQPGAPQASKLPSDLPGVQLIVRGEPSKARQAFELAEAAYDLMQALGHVTLDEGGPDEVRLIGCTFEQSSPVPIGRDDQQRPEYTLNASLRTHNPTQHRPAVTA